MKRIEALLLAASLLVAAPGGVHGSDEEGTRPADRGATLEVVSTLAGHEGRVRSLAFSPDGEVLASGGLDRTLRLWDFDERKALAVVTLPRSG